MLSNGRLLFVASVVTVLVIVFFVGCPKAVFAADNSIDQVELGYSSGAVIKTDGSLWMWGGGLGFTASKIMENVEQVSLGQRNYCGVIRKDGSLWMWGDNSEGQIGDGTSEDKCNPVKIMENVKQVSLGYEQSAAVKIDGSLWMWGELEYSHSFSTLSPKKIMEDVKKVSVGNGFYAVIKGDDSLWMWGANTYGQLGIGTSGGYVSNISDSPIKIMDNVRDVCLGDDFSSAIKYDGSLWMWGDNDHGNIGNGRSSIEENVCSPVKVMDNVKQVSLGRNQSAALKEDGSLWSWGSCYLGNGTCDKSNIPVKVLLDNVKQVSLGSESAAAVNLDGSLWMWGQYDNSEMEVFGVDIIYFNSNFLSPDKIDFPNIKYNDPCISGHSWNSPTYSWASDNSKVTATRICKNNSTHVLTETVSTTPAITKQATYTAMGETTYTAIFENGKFATQNKTVANIPRLIETPKPAQSSQSEQSSEEVPAKVKVVKKVHISHLQKLKSKYIIAYGGKLKLKIKTNGKLTYKVANKKILTVSKKGVVTAKQYGITKITIKDKFGKKTKKKVITITVVPKEAKITKVKSKSYTLAIILGKRDSTITGYQIYASGRKDFKTGTIATSIPISKVKKTTIVLKMPKNQKYFIKLRAYKQVGKKKYYGPWSNVKATK